MIPGLLPEDLPTSEGWAVEDTKLTTHKGTYLDAPWHYHSTMDNGHRAITSDEAPLDGCMRLGVNRLKGNRKYSQTA
jgi:kynurenine formamidase